LLTHKDAWFRHDNADVALIPLVLGESQVEYRFKAIALSAFIGSDYQFSPPPGTFGPQFQFHQGANTSPTAFPVEVGDDLFFPGLFVHPRAQNACYRLLALATSHACQQMSMYL
jgi:hypothetical protein